MAGVISTPPRSVTELFSDSAETNPLWLKHHLFLSPSFDSESYVTDLRTFVPLETLRSELRNYARSLNSQLIDLINRDYDDFVSLSTKLVNVDDTVVRMRAPLLDLREKISEFRASVEETLAALQDGLNQRSKAASVRDVLELLLDVFHVVYKVEKLIQELPSVSADWSMRVEYSDENILPNSNSSLSVDNRSNSSGPWSMLLDRIASEMNRLKLNLSHVKNLLFIDNMEKRISNASSLLRSGLKHCFISGLQQRDNTTIYNCLRAYASIDDTKSAEDIFRGVIVAPIVHKIIPYESQGCHSDTSGYRLENDYQKMKQSIEECKFILDITYTENSGLHGFSFLANSILKEILFAIVKGKPAVLSPGKPSEFLANYKASLDFLEHLEGYCPSRIALAKFRTEDVYNEFLKQWNVGVYFSLRFQEIAGALDSTLSASCLLPVDTAYNGNMNSQTLLLKQSISLLECLEACWKDDVYIFTCSDKFLRLSFQLISRFSNYLSFGLAARKSGDTSTELCPEWAMCATADDFSRLIHDIECLEKEITGNYLEHVLGILNTCSSQILGTVKEGFLQGGKLLLDSLPLVMDLTVEAIVDKCVEEIKQVKGISATYRMTNKPLPVRHSPYLSSILFPLKAFLEGKTASTFLSSETRSKLLLSASTKITDRYYELASEIVTAARKTESSLQRLRQGVQRRGGANSDVSDHAVSDTEKICTQLFLDIQEYGRNLRALGIDPETISSYCAFWKCVAPADRLSISI